MARRSMLAGGCLALLLAAGGWWLAGGSDVAVLVPATPAAREQPADAVITPDSGATRVRALEPPAAPRVAQAQRTPLSASQDLRAVYEQFRSGDSPRDRNIAYRAWSACFPAFIAPQGGAVPLETMTASLPHNAPNSAAREQALRDLWGRCQRFSDWSREQLLAETQRQADAMLTGRAASPGISAANAYQAGDAARALAIARAAVASQDPDAIDSLQEFVKLYWWDHNDRNPGLQIQRPDLRAMAFSLAACQFGLDCAAASLTALQQCAFTGACEGSVIDRQLQGLPDAADRDMVMAETARVVSAIRARDYKGLGLQ